MLASFDAMVGGLQLPEAAVPDDSCWQLSRFALLRRIQDDLMLESPLCTVAATLHPGATAVIGALSRPRVMRQLIHDTRSNMS